MNDLFLSVGIELIVAPNRQLDALVRRMPCLLLAILEMLHLHQRTLDQGSNSSLAIPIRESTLLLNPNEKEFSLNLSNVAFPLRKCPPLQLVIHYC